MNRRRAPGLRIPEAQQAEREVFNEAQKIERRFQSLKKRIERFKSSKPVLRPYRYVLNFEYDVSQEPTADLLGEQEQSFLVRAGSVFFVKALSFRFAAQGTLRDNGQSVSLNPGSNAWRRFIEFEWRVRDTGAFSREWQNRALPGQLLMSNAVNPLLFGNGHCRLEPGTEVIFTLIPTAFSYPDNLSGDTFSSLAAYRTEVTFFGEELIQ